MSHCRPYSGSAVETLDISYRILADHSRMFTIAISDGLLPGYRGTGFILRKIIRKSIGIAANDFGISNPRPLFSQLIGITNELLSEPFPELNENMKRVNQVIEEEIEKYEAVVSGNKQLVKALNQIDVKYSIDLRENIDQKILDIQNEMDIRLRDNDIDKQFLETKRNYLFSIKDIRRDYTINLRHNLSPDLSERVDKLIQRVDDIENQLISMFKQEFQSIISNDSEEYFVYQIKTSGDSKTAFKVGLDFFGRKPTALFHKSSKGSEFCVQTTVPNEYQKYMKANEWMSHILNQLENYEILSKKRTHKMSLFKSNSINQMKEAINCAQIIANLKFNKKSIE